MKSNAGALKLLFRQLYLYKQLLSGKCDKGSKKEWPPRLFLRLKLKTPFQVGGLGGLVVKLQQINFSSRAKKSASASCLLKNLVLLDDVNSNWIFLKQKFCQLLGCKTSIVQENQ